MRGPQNIITGGIGCRRKVNPVTTPKLPPPPRTACRTGRRVRPHRREATVPVRGDDVPRLQDCRRTAHAFPAASRSPRESVRPATPVCDIRPPGVARPNATVSQSTSPHKSATLYAQALRAARIDPHRAHRREVDHQAGVTDRVAGDIVSAAADRQRQGMAARKGDARRSRRQRRHSGQ